MNEKSLYLIKVDPSANNNKYYRMIPKGDTFEVQYGRVGNTNYQTEIYPISKWDTKLHEKKRKGYVDQTRLMAVPTTTSGSALDLSGYAPIPVQSINTIVHRLQSMAKQAIEDNYTISSNKVTQTMIYEAQALISQLHLTTEKSNFNYLLVDLFRTIPRKMKNVSDELAYSNSDFSRILRREQDLLDIMQTQVVQQQIENEEEPVKVEPRTILEKMGLQFFEITPEDKTLIKNSLEGLSDKFNNAWKVINNKTQKQFDAFIEKENITNKKLLWHGSRNENWWSIINMGLVLRPNAVTTGKMFGYGIYFAPSARKSFGYTSYSGSYWAGGTSNVAFMSLFDVAYGKPYDIYSYDYGTGAMNYDSLQVKCKGAHCLHAHAGNMLRNDEIVVYKEDQITIKYLVELK